MKSIRNTLSRRQGLVALLLGGGWATLCSAVVPEKPCGKLIMSSRSVPQFVNLFIRHQNQIYAYILTYVPLGRSLED